ncbi:MAG: hypothetical protein ACLRT5_03550 [Lachnospiraceae bacterium]
MDKFTIIANSVKDRNFVVSHRIAEYLRNNGKECLMLQDMGEEQNASYHYTDPDRIPDDTRVHHWCWEETGRFCRRPGMWWTRTSPCLVSTWEPWDIWRRSTNIPFIRRWTG